MFRANQREPSVDEFDWPM